MRRWFWLAALCLLAFALSHAYVAYYLRGGPRIIDATSYWLEARSLAAGSFGFDVAEPTAAFRGRFLLADADGRRLGVIFPPGYPLLLAAGMLAGAPLLVGPVLGALLVAATYFLALGVTGDRKVALLSAALSASCAALRYHSADTMSHGLSALLACLALGLALRRDWPLSSLLAGLCLGWLAATRPVSAGVALVLCAAALRRAGARHWLQLALGALPGVALLLAQQRALTGSWWGSTQLAYYALADAPPGCFRYGFGAGVGCRYEHGDFVSRYLPEGYGPSAALRAFFVRAWVFLTDATNAVPLTLLAAFAALRHLRTPLALLAACVVLQALAYVPFYFDGNYPGGGARFLCEAIPACQILVARAAVDLRLTRWVVPVSLAGFALYAERGHRQLRDREGGRPMFEQQVLSRAGAARGLVFVDTDHGFNLGHDPGVTDPGAGVVVARLRGDAHDRELYERLGRPPTRRYAYDLSGARPPELLDFVPPPARPWEAEAEWPALLERGSAYPVHVPCASAGRALRLLPGSVVRFQPPAKGWEGGIELGWASTGLSVPPAGRSTALPAGEAALRVGWTGSPAQILKFGAGCSRLTFPGRRPDPEAWLEVELVSGEGAVDYLAGRAVSP